MPVCYTLSSALTHHIEAVPRPEASPCAGERERAPCCRARSLWEDL